MIFCHHSKIYEVNNMVDSNSSIKLTEKEAQLIKMVRELGFGEIRIFVADSQPVRAEEIKKTVKFN